MAKAKTRAGKKHGKGGAKKKAPQYRTVMRYAETSATKEFAPVKAAEPAEPTAWRTVTRHAAPSEPFFHSRGPRKPRNDPFEVVDTALAGVSNAIRKLPTKHKAMLLGGAALATLTVWTLAARAAARALAPSSPAPGNVQA